VDLNAIADWMSTRGLGAGELDDVAELSGGTQNVMLRFTRSGRSYVLRRGPRHLRPRSNTVILRETRVLAALAGSDVPHPGLIATCDDPGVLGDAVFYLMEPVDGFNAGEGLPPLHAGDPALRHEMGLSMADALAKLGAVDHVAVGLGDFGKPDGFLERQVPRWLSELESYRQFDNYPGPGMSGVDDVAAWLEHHRPASWTPGIMHGDYHAANVMFSRTGPEVVASVDWEMCTIGDPLLDLGWLLATWPGRDGSSVLDQTFTAAEGLAGADELIERYAGHTGRDLSHLVHGVGVLQARHRAGRHVRAGLRGQSPARGRRPAALGHAAPVRARAAADAAAAVIEPARLAAIGG
jgi:aminoglycoside phosphotransferase (APT) family kinase protein